MIRLTVRHVFLCVILLYSWGCAQKSAKLQKSVVPPDKTLFETGQEFLKKSQYIKARLTFQTLMNTYPDSEMASDALLAIGDSYYDEGGTENLLQAEDSYKNFVVFFPASPKAQDADFKIIALNIKMMHAPDRDAHNAYKAEESINRFLQQHPDSDYVPIAKQSLLDVQENLALGVFGVGQFYEEKRKNYAGARMRYQDILDKYPSFSQMDEVLFRLGGVLEKSNNPDEAAIQYAKIVSAHPFSEHADEAKARLNSLGKPIPAVDIQLAAQNQFRVKAPEGFSPLKPFIKFAESLGFTGQPDLFQQAKKTVEDEKKTAEAAAAKTGAGGQGSDIQIEDVIKKSASGETQDATTLGAASSPTEPTSADQKKETKKKNKKKNVEKSS